MPKPLNGQTRAVCTECLCDAGSESARQARTLTNGVEVEDRDVVAGAVEDVVLEVDEVALLLRRIRRDGRHGAQHILDETRAADQSFLREQQAARRRR